MNTQGAKLLLYVEDNLDHADLVLHSLSRQNPATRVVHVEDGEAALDYLRRSEAGADPRPWLILLDLKLPRMDGFEVLRAVKASPEFLDIPVVVLTTSSSDADIEKAYQSHVNSYLVKPVDFPSMDELIRALDHYWLANNTLPSAGH
jgi:CheY-like chemotaxis protein